MIFLILQYNHFSRLFLLFTPNCSSQHIVAEHPQSLFLPRSARPVLTPQQYTNMYSACVSDFWSSSAAITSNYSYNRIYCQLLYFQPNNAFVDRKWNIWKFQSPKSF